MTQKEEAPAGSAIAISQATLSVMVASPAVKSLNEGDERGDKKTKKSET